MRLTTGRIYRAKKGYTLCWDAAIYIVIGDDIWGSNPIPTNSFKAMPRGRGLFIYEGKPKILPLNMYFIMYGVEEI